MSYTYPKAFRVKKRADFLRIQNQGRKYRASNFLLICSPRKIKGDGLQSGASASDSHLYCNRLGITVTTKVDKRAVGRNMIKRRWREFFRTRHHGLERGWDFVVIALQGAVEQSHDDFVREAYYLFRKSGLFRKSEQWREQRNKQ